MALDQSTAHGLPSQRLLQSLLRYWAGMFTFLTEMRHRKLPEFSRSLLVCSRTLQGLLPLGVHQHHVNHELCAWNESSSLCTLQSLTHVFNRHFPWRRELITQLYPPSPEFSSVVFLQPEFVLNETLWWNTPRLVTGWSYKGCRMGRLGKNEWERMSEVGWLQSGFEGFWMWKSGRPGNNRDVEKKEYQRKCVED